MKRFLCLLLCAALLAALGIPAAAEGESADVLFSSSAGCLLMRFDSERRILPMQATF